MLRESPSFDSVIKTPYLWSEVEQSDLESYAVKLSLLHASYPEQDDSLRASFDAMYSRLLEDLSPLQRSHIIDEVYASLQVGIAAVNTLLLFVHAEPDPSTAAIAAIYTAHLTPLIGNDPLSSLSMLAGLYEHEQTPERLRVGLFSGLLLLGDRRVLPILDRLWGLLGPQGKRRVLEATSGIAYASKVDFLLDRLGKEPEDGLFGSLAAALYRLPRETEMGPRPGYVVDIECRLPSSLRDDEPTVKILGEWPVEEYGACIAPRLRKIAREESEPKVLPMVMAQWGIDPDGVKNAGKSRQAPWTIAAIRQVPDLVVPHVVGLWAASGEKEIEWEWKAIHDIMDPHGLKWMVDAVERYQNAPSFVAWVKDPNIPPFPPVVFNVTLNLEQNDAGYLMRWDIACVRTDEPDLWVAIYRVVMNAADEGGKGILRHLARADVLLFSLMSGKDHLEIHANQRGQALLAALCIPVWRGLFPVEWPQEQRERCRDFLLEIEANPPSHLMGLQELSEHVQQTMPGLNWQPVLDAEG